MTEFDFQSGYERFDAAMAGGGAPEVPFTAQMHEFSMAYMREPGHKFYRDAETFTRGICTTARDFGFDTPSFIWDAYNVEAEALGVPLVLFDDMAPALDNVTPFILNEKDLAALKSPDPATAGRMPMVAEILHLLTEYTGRRPSLGFCAPFTMAAHLMTFENLIVAMGENPAYVHKVMDFIVDEVLLPYFHYMHRQFPDLLSFDGSDATASIPFITLDMQEEFALGPILRLQEKAGLPCYVDNWWGDSFTDDKEGYWQGKLKATPDYLKIQDPDLWKIGLAEAMDFARKHDKPVVLGIDNNLFQQGPEIEIEKRVHEYMEVIEEAGGRGQVYFCSLSAVTPPEHARSAIEAVHKFRRGDRPWAGLRRAGTAEALGDDAGAKTKKDTKSTVSMGRSAAPDTEEDIILDDIFDAVMDGDEKETPVLVNKALDHDIDVQTILNDSLISAMDDIGDEFSAGTIFVPEMLLAARAMKAGLEIVRPILTSTGEPSRGKVLLATVQGDVHDIGKNLVGMMLEGAGYEIVNLGVNAKPEDILAAAYEIEPDVVGLSALLTTSMPSMQKTVSLFKEKAAPYPVIIGGAPVTGHFAEVIGADGYGENAPLAVEAVHNLIAAATAQPEASAA